MKLTHEDYDRLTVMTVKGEFTADQVRAAGADLRVHVRMRVDEHVVGGMSYQLDPDLKRPPHVRPGGKHSRLDEIVEELLGEAKHGRRVEDVSITHIVVDIELGDDCDDG